MAKIYSRGGRLYASWTIDKRRFRRALGLDDTPENRARAIEEILPDVKRQAELKIAPRKNFKLSSFVDEVIEGVEKISTEAAYESYKQAVFAVLPDKNIEDYSPLDFDIATKKLRARGLKDNSLRAYFAPFKSAFTLAIQKGVIDRNPCILPRLHVKVQPKSAYSPQEVAAMLQEAEGELKAFLYFAFYSGARCGEILALTWGDIGERAISISKTLVHTLGAISQTPKNGKNRYVVLLDPLKSFIATMKRGEESERIFKLDVRTMQRKFKALCERLGFEVQTLHSTRHTFISQCVASGLDLALIARNVGHSNIDMITRVYTHYIPSEENIAKMQKAFAK